MNLSRPPPSQNSHGDLLLLWYSDEIEGTRDSQLLVHGRTFTVRQAAAEGHASPCPARCLCRLPRSDCVVTIQSGRLRVRTLPPPVSRICTPPRKATTFTITVGGRSYFWPTQFWALAAQSRRQENHTKLWLQRQVTLWPWCCGKKPHFLFGCAVD